MSLLGRVVVGLAWLAFAVLALARLAAASPTSTDSGNVILQVIQCRLGVSEEPRVSIAPAAEWPKLQYAPANSSLVRADRGFFIVTVPLPQGNYFYQLDSEHCTGYTQAAVLAAHSRTLSLALMTRGHYSKISYVKLIGIANAVAGTLAIRPDVGWIVSASGSKRVLDLQEGAFYVDRVYPGKYSLRFELHGGFQSEINVDLSSISSTQLVERDIDLLTFRQNLGNILKSGAALKECYWCY